MGALETLLIVQEHDSALLHLRHRRSHLPEQQQLEACERRLAALEAELAPTLAESARLEARQAELETAIHAVDAKIEAAERQLYSGSVTATRELQALEADIASQKRHRSDLEDTELAILEEREPIDAALAQAAARRTAIDAEAMALRAAAAEAAVAIDADIASHEAARTAVVAEVPATMLAVYDKVRAGSSGIGIARLEHGTCMACRMKLSAVDLDRIRHESSEAIVRCEECSAILVR